MLWYRNNYIHSNSTWSFPSIIIPAMYTVPINPRYACATRVPGSLSLTGFNQGACSSYIPGLCVCLCVCLLPRFLPQTGQKATPTGFALHSLDFKFGDCRKSTSFKSYGVKTKSTSQYYANQYLPTSIGSARSVYLEGIRSHNEGRASTPTCYLLLSLPRVRLSAS